MCSVFDSSVPEERIKTTYNLSEDDSRDSPQSEKGNRSGTILARFPDKLNRCQNSDGNVKTSKTTKRT